MSTIEIQGRIDDQAKQSRRAAAAAVFGSTLEFYEFNIYASASALVFGHVFFPDSNPVVGTLLSLATFGIAFAVRPLSAMVLGHFGERLGRKTMLMLTLGLMGAATFGIGCLPDYNTIGYWAPALLVFLRFVQGFSAAGEQPGAGVLALEHAPEGRRAFYTSWMPAGSQLGFGIATLVFLGVATLPDEDLFTWGWRVPFWASALIVVIAYIIRHRVQEPEVYADKRKKNEIPAYPIATLFRTHRAATIRVIICALEAVIYSVYAAFALAFATSVGVPRTTMLLVAVVGCAVAVCMYPVWALLADRIGRKPVFIFGLLGSGASVLFYFWAISTAMIPLIFVGAILLIGVFYSAVDGIFPSFFAEMFNTRVRFTGVVVGTQLGFTAAGFAPSIAWSLVGDDATHWLPVALMVVVVCLIAAAAAFTARETYRTPLDELGNPVGK